MKILIVGCGYLGTALGENLIKAGHEVWGVRRHPLASESLVKKGIRPITLDLLKPGVLLDLPAADVLVFCQAPKHDTDNYRDTYYLATLNVLKSLEGKKVGKIIFISSTSVYATSDGAWVDEFTPTGGEGFETKEAAENAQWLLNAENLVLVSAIPSIVLRLGGIYGPGRHRLRALKEGKMKPSFSGTFINRIHRDDIVSAIRLLMEKGKAGEIYLGVDDRPTTQEEFYEWLYEKMGLPRPFSVSGAIPRSVHGSNKRCSNQKMKKLGWVLKYPSFREGYTELIKEINASSPNASIGDQT